jgi:outer membrane protein assembly factor BamD (BamD/ComL family)
MQVFLLATVINVSCSNARKEMLQNIENLRQEVYAEAPGIPDPARADALASACLAFAERYPGDTLAPAMIYDAADLMMNMGKHGEAFSQFERLRRDYPEHEKSEVALFLMAFITENELGDLGRARDLYGQFLKEYPNSDFADDARACIQNLGKSPEDILRSFQAKQDSLAMATPSSTE